MVLWAYCVRGYARICGFRVSGGFLLHEALQEEARGRWH